MMFYVYVLQCFIELKYEFYIGYCSNLKNRIYQHLNKEVKTTSKFDSLKLVYYESCINKTDAIKRELQLKTGYGRGYLKRRLETYLKRDSYSGNMLPSQGREASSILVSRSS